MDYFDAELKRFKEMIEVPLMTRRLESHKEDPMEELMEVYADVDEQEQNFAKCINIASKYLPIILIISNIFIQFPLQIS